MIRRSDVTVLSDGVTPEPNIYITVKDDTGALATLYDDSGNLMSNPFASDAVTARFTYNIADGDAGTFTEEFRINLADAPRTIEAISLTTGEALDGILTPELFAAVGDGIANDTTAFQQLAAAINAADGGVISLRPGATYLVGEQNLVNNGTWMFQGEAILTIDGCAKPFTLYCNGAKFKLAAGLKFGTFNAAGASTTHPLPYTGGDRSDPMAEAMVVIKNCTGFVTIVGGLELDGNDAAQTIGGPFGDTGWQLPADGFWLYNNSGGEDVSGVYSHHHLRDGYIILGGPTTTGSTAMQGSTIRVCRSEYNGRQALSFIGGKGYTFIGCKFNKTGRSVLFSAPGAGVDLEAESGIIRDLQFIGCEFVDNSGVGLVADSGDTADVVFDKCRFVGTTTWSLWPVKPGFVFNDCKIIGAFVNPYSNADRRLATNFIRCLFSDEAALSPTGVVAGGGILNFAGSGAGVFLDRCTIHATNQNVGDPSGVIFRDCNVTVDNPFSGAPFNSRFEGRNVWSAPAMVPGAFAGHIGTNPSAFFHVQSGEYYKGSAVYNPPSLAAGATSTVAVTVVGANSGDILFPTFSLPLQGVRLTAEVTTEAAGLVAGVVTVTFTNTTAGVIDLGSGTVRVGIIGAKA